MGGEGRPSLPLQEVIKAYANSGDAVGAQRPWTDAQGWHHAQ